MSVKELFLCCKRGDLYRVQYLVEQKDVELNVKDKWDSTPLYYACLCGHEEVVRYLLEMGASCEANTFEGERCLYGALNNSIRNLLKSYKQVTSSTMRRDLYAEFLRRLLDRGIHSDLTFVVQGQNFPVHKCILSVRCKYFGDLFKTKWSGKKEIQLTNILIVPKAFSALLRWLYTGCLESHIDDVEDILRLAKHCQLHTLTEDLEQKLHSVLQFESSKPGVCVNIVNLEPAPSCQTLQEDLSTLADLALPAGLWDQCGVEMPFLQQEVQLFPDIVFSVEGHQFHCHKAFFLCRSDYFKALEEDHFGEHTLHGCPSCDLPVITLTNITVRVFEQVVSYLYQDSCQLTEETIYDVLFAGDLYLLPGLKRYCAGVLSKYLDLDNVVAIIRTARMFDLSKLEDDCAAFMAEYIEKMVEQDDFKRLVLEDARSVQGREETDSIPIIDDIRFHMTNFLQSFSDMYETNDKVALIDTFLENLNLEA